jgi:hypothetical protein
MATISPGGAYLLPPSTEVPVAHLDRSAARFLRADDLKRHVRTVHSKDVDNQLCVSPIHRCIRKTPSDYYLATLSTTIRKNSRKASAAWQRQRMPPNLNGRAGNSPTQRQLPTTVEACPVLPSSITTLRSRLKCSLKRSLPMPRAKGMGPMAR